ncbi:hypothetical protein NP233_g12667 [Leucocoprinus birnbaumii]|uniref:C2H2-type domain-containing protein n=1 Tax=Leucocoprinus birnbaumii TaxID=56174 RepID=A0AAD5VE76_9AGAR|nr:hypothetical protein NP233_g12667 [Leucocoprinus birnbaumii]
MFPCDGCPKTFRRKRDYMFHGQQSTQISCKEAYDEFLRAEAVSDDLDFDRSGEDSDSEEKSPVNTTPVSFQGDIFGTATDYRDDDFGQLDMTIELDEPELLAQGEVDLEVEAFPGDTVEEELVAQQESSWEPERLESTRSQLGDEQVPTNSHSTDTGVASAAVPALGVNNALDPDAPDPSVLSLLSEARRSVEHILVNAGHGPEPQSIITYNDHYPRSKFDWEIAQWAKLRGPSSTAFSELLAIDGISEKLGLSYKTTDELNRKIEQHLPGRPQFHRREIVVGGESFEFYSRDIMECIKSLWRDPQFANDLIVEPERHYADEDETVRMYHDMHTGKWWWNTQKALDRTGKTRSTIIPVMISSDKTQLTQFRNKVAYPVYLTIGNLPKHIRRKPSRQGQILLAYLPTTKLEHITNQASRRRTLTNMFHACLKFIMRPLETAGKEGEYMLSGDGLIRRCFPILATYIGDYPEQVLVTLVKTGECPVCEADRNELGSLESIGPPREIAPILSALEELEAGNAQGFVDACADVGIKPVPLPFWKDLPFLNIYSSITPDILHQLYQGVLKHVISWLIQACGHAEVDARCRRLPMNHHIRLFMKGISSLSRVTGTEHDQICRFLLGVVNDIQILQGHSNGRLIRAVRSILDFTYLARYPIHTSETLNQLENALFLFHENASIFIDLGIRPHMNFPKLHFCGHYRYLIELFGTTDNYNTEYTERLHIDYAKDAYRATNFRDELPQMTTWLDRKERVLQHARTINQRLELKAQCEPPMFTSRDINSPDQQPIQRPLPCLVYRRIPQLPKFPSVGSVSFEDIRTQYGATFFEPALSRFVAHYQNPTFTRTQLERASYSVDIRFYKVPVYHYLKFVARDPYALPNSPPMVVDAIYAKPGYPNKKGETIPGRFDTAIIDTASRNETGAIEGCQVGRIRCIFSLPQSAVNVWFPHGWSHPHLAYVQWYTSFRKAQLDPNSQLYQVSPIIKDGEHQASIVPLSLIKQSVHLLPKFGPVAPVDWKSSTVLDQARVFYVNSFTDRFSYSTVY